MNLIRSQKKYKVQVRKFMDFDLRPDRKGKREELFI